MSSDTDESLITALEAIHPTDACDGDFIVVKVGEAYEGFCTGCPFTLKYLHV